MNGRRFDKEQDIYINQSKRSHDEHHVLDPAGPTAQQPARTEWFEPSKVPQK